MTGALYKQRTDDDPAPIGVATRDRAASAHQLQLAGHSWSTIAERTGYRSAKVCAMAVKAYLQKAAGEQAPRRRQQALELEMQRLAALQTAYWDAAIAGDVVAAGVVLKIMAERVKLLGLDHAQPQPQRQSQLYAAAQLTLVIAGTSEEYVAQLQAIVGGDPQSMAKHWPDDSPTDPFGRVHPPAVLERVRTASGACNRVLRANFALQLRRTTPHRGARTT